MSVLRNALIFCLFSSAVMAATEPPKVEPPADPRTIKPLVVPMIPATDWPKHLESFQNPDLETQKAATKIFIDAGGRGFLELATLLNSPNLDVARRAKAVREEIEQKSFQRYQEVLMMHQKIQNEPLDVARLQELNQAWVAMAAYVNHNALKQSGFQQAVEVQKKIQQVEQTQAELKGLDESLKATPADQTLVRAALELDRARALKMLQRTDEALAAANAAFATGGPQWRLAPATLELLAELYCFKQDSKNWQSMCQKILDEYPRSLQVKFAYKNLIEILKLNGEWDTAIQLSKTFISSFPIDEEAQDEAYNLLTSLMDEERDYARVAPLADWIIRTLPRERLTGDAPKLAGGCAEYVRKDYTAAETAYAMLRDVFPDQISGEDIKAVLERLKSKKEGKFPKEPTETEPGAAGAFAKFMKAVRAHDETALLTLIPKAEAKVYQDHAVILDLMPTIVFADLIVKKVDADEKAGKATIHIDYYDASRNVPTAMQQKALLEDGAWKIQWVNPDEAEEEEDPGEEIAPMEDVKK